MNTWRERMGIRVANWVLKTFAPKSSRVIGNLIKVGMATCDEWMDGRLAVPEEWK